MSEPTVRLSVVIPVWGSPEGLAAAVAGYGRAIAELGEPFEVLLVTEPGKSGVCAQLAQEHDWLRVCDQRSGGWGTGVSIGLNASAGEILCYCNWRWTSAEALAEMLSFAASNPELVFRANRRTRDTRRQRLGSLVFNLECRALLAVTAWDVNGTPKVFSRNRSKLLELRQGDDLIDAEFALVCEREAYPVAEIPIEAESMAGAVRKPDYLAALKMYIGVLGLRRRLGSASSS